MRRAILAAAALILLGTGPAVAQRPVLVGEAGACLRGGPAIRVNIQGLKDRSGRLKLELYPANEDDFLKDDTILKREGKYFHRVWAQTPASGDVAMCIQAPQPGRYALLFTHDRDGRNKFNFWQDGAGFPSNRKLGRSRPKLEEAAIQIGGGVTTVTIRAQYLQGLSGFSPMKSRD